MHLFTAQSWGSLLIALGLCVAALAGATAYWVPLDRSDDLLASLTLADDAGMAVDQDGIGRGEPLVSATIAGVGVTLNDEVLRKLRDNRWRDARGLEHRVRRVRVREFRWSTWSGKWWFLAALGAMLTGARLLGSSAKGGPELDQGRRQEALMTAFRALERTLEDLQTEVHRRTDRTQQRSAVLRWGNQIQEREAARFIACCQEGLAGPEATRSVRLLERFAVTERYLNRAWSTATDGDLPEALDALEIAVRNLLEMESLVDVH